MRKLAHVLVCLVPFLLLFIKDSAAAKLTTSKKNTSTNKYASLVIDANNGVVLYNNNADKLRHPASLTKMMTLYLTFEAIKEGRFTLNDKLTVSAYAATRPKSNIGLKAGEKIYVKDAILAAIVKSANDAVVVLAEAISKDEKIFALKMTKRAHDLGMDNTVFRNASGLHHREQVSTAYDMAKLAMALYRDFSSFYYLFSRTNFVFKGVNYKGHNNVLNTYHGATGLKTGFINASGYNLVTSASRGGKRLIGVVFGEETAQRRDVKMISLLNKHFSNKLIKANDPTLDEFIDIVSNGQSKQITLAQKVAVYNNSPQLKLKTIHNNNKIKRNKRYMHYYTNVAMNSSKADQSKAKKTKR